VLNACGTPEEGADTEKIHMVNSFISAADKPHTLAG